MPIYEYQCDKCHHHLEALQKLTDKPLRECPECGKHALRRLISAPRFRLAGSGWYETDFKADGERKRNLVEKEKGEAPAAVANSTDAKAEKPADSATKESSSKETSSGKESSGKESSGKESSGKESSGSESSSKRRVASKPVAVAKPASKPKPRVASRPAARKLVRKR